MKNKIMLSVVILGLVGCNNMANIAQSSMNTKANETVSVAKGMMKAEKEPTITPVYIEYACQNKTKLEVSYVFVDEQPMTASTKLNNKPAGILEFSKEQSNEDTRVLSYKTTRLLLDSGFNLSNSKENVSLMLTKEGKKTTNILAKNCKISVVR
ncbi:excinuclease ABC subunit A [Pasteurella multocida subsp. multocida OH4807]|nr:excinuclease ABC subunit A [Pasteurella multocida subsp. multocida OH4807]